MTMAVVVGRGMRFLDYLGAGGCVLKEYWNWFLHGIVLMVFDMHKTCLRYASCSPWVDIWCVCFGMIC